uniref:ABC-type glutathione-S-conjugate transporter n=1 Tax=Latimeria chalumnae TaxID=7897 RepID=H3AES0_LATCH
LLHCFCLVIIYRLKKNTENPDLTTCFQNTVLAWIPCIYLWITFPIYHLYLKCNNKGYLVVSVLNRLKTIFLIAKLCINLFYSFYEFTRALPTAPAQYISPLIVGTTMLLATLLIQYERLRGVQSSGVLFIFWLISLLCGIVPFRSKIMTTMSQVKTLLFATFYIYYALLLAELILCCIKESPPLFSSLNTDPNPCPESSAGFLSLMTFWWFTSMAIKGYKHPLENKDLWSLNKQDASDVVVPCLLKEWAKEKGKVKRKSTRICFKASLSVYFRNEEVIYTKTSQKVLNHVDGSPDEAEVLIPNKTEARGPSFLKALLRAFGPYFLIGSVYKLAQDLLTFVNPQLLNMLIAFINSPDAPSWWGFLIAILMFLCAALQTIILHQHFQYCFVTGMRLKTAIIGSIYRKSLVITNSAKRSSTVGEIVNLMSVDAQRFMDLTTFLNMLWSAPLQICLALYFLWQKLGPSVLAGVAVMILLIPFNAIIAMKTRAFQVELMLYKDSRIKLMNEILNGIKVLKLYAWEPSFLKKVQEVRKNELKVLKKSAYLNAVSTFAWSSAPFLVVLDCVKFYEVVRENSTFNAGLCFFSITWNRIRFVLIALFMLVCNNFRFQVRSSQAMFEGNLNSDGMDNKTHQLPESQLGYAITVLNGKFSWVKSNPPILHDINLMVPYGSLVAVVGHVGCGKSSLVSALLGEVEKLEGKVSIRGSVAYVPQQAWIQNATLKDNILFGQPFNEEKYQKVLEACALVTDLEMLPGGDQTEIGEKGINLSGGQKQRVSLARALYSESEVFLLDDPLSAVDSHVAKHIFDNVIGPGGALNGKTRILVTHGISFLPQVNQIVVLVDGKVTEMGSYQDLLKQNGAFAEFLRNYAPDEDIEEDEPTEETLSNHVDLTDNEPIANEARKQFLSIEQKRQNSVYKQISVMSSDGECPKKMSTRRKLCEKIPTEPAVQKKNAEVNKLIQTETTETGRVKLKVFWQYIQAVGPAISMFICLLYCCQNAANIGANYWLSDWTNEQIINGTQQNTRMRVGVYAALGLSQ